MPTLHKEVCLQLEQYMATLHREDCIAVGAVCQPYIESAKTSPYSFLVIIITSMPGNIMSLLKG